MVLHNKHTKGFQSDESSVMIDKSLPLKAQYRLTSILFETNGTACNIVGFGYQPNASKTRFFIKGEG